MKAVGNRNTITWWGVANVEIHLNGLGFGFDPYLYPTEPRLEYIFITHEHYDHFHEPTLRPLAENSQLKALMAPKSCYFASQLNSPTTEDPEPSNLTWADKHRTMVFYPKVTPGGTVYGGPSEARMGQLYVLGVGSGEDPQEWADFTPLQEPFPTVGYVVKDEESEISFYHPGDIEYVFDELAQLRGKVTHLLLPIGKLNGQESRMVELVQPKYVIPVHYRLDTPDWPIPLSINEDEIRHASWITGHPLPGVDWHSADYLADISKLIKGHWYPTPQDPKDFLRNLKTQIGSMAEILVLHAGREYLIDVETGVIEGAMSIE